MCFLTFSECLLSLTLRKCSISSFLGLSIVISMSLFSSIISSRLETVGSVLRTDSVELESEECSGCSRNYGRFKAFLGTELEVEEFGLPNSSVLFIYGRLNDTENLLFLKVLILDPYRTSKTFFLFNSS